MTINTVQYQQRKARPGDEAQILSLVSRVLAGYGLYTDQEKTDSDLHDLDASYFNNRGWFAVLEQDGVIVGSWGICNIDDTTCELRKMYLLPEFQGLGLGKKILEDAMNKAREMGYHEMVLESNSLLDKALGLYKKYGFEEYHPKHLSSRCDIALKRNL